MTQSDFKSLSKFSKNLPVRFAIRLIKSQETTIIEQKTCISVQSAYNPFPSVQYQ